MASRSCRWLKRIGAVLCLLIFAAFVFSTRRTLLWDSPTIRHEFQLGLGMIAYGWRPEGWRPEDERYPSKPGWQVAYYEGWPALEWRITSSTSKHWDGVSVPLWMPFVIVGVPTAFLWYADRRSIRDTIRRWSVRLTPRSPKKVTIGLVVAFSVVHAVAVFLCFGLLMGAHDFFLFPRPTGGAYPAIVRAADVLFPILVSLVILFLWTTPLWAVLWAWGFTRLRNRLFRMQPGHYCLNCGYNLTGNVSGICPECGERIGRRLTNAGS